MDAPSVGPLPATPSNFEAAMAARGNMQPTAGEQSNAPATPSVGWNQAPKQPAANEGAKLGDFAEERAAQGEPDPNAPPEEPQYDADGNEIDPKAEAQRAEAMEQIRAALDTGELPFELLKDMQLEVTVNGEQRKVSLEEARGGYMRRAHFTRELEKAQGIAHQAQNILNLERARNQEWNNPQALRQGLRQLGLEESFMRAAYSWAEERVSYMKKPPTERALIDQIQKIELEREQAAAQMRHQQMLQQQQQSQQPDPATQQVFAQLQQIMPRVFRQHGIGSYPLAQQTFLQQLQAFCPDGNITKERCDEAALATKEFLSDLDRIRQEQQQQPQGGPGYPLAPRRLAAGPQRGLTLGNVLTQTSNGRPANGNGQAGRRPSDFVRKMGLG